MPAYLHDDRVRRLFDRFLAEPAYRGWIGRMEAALTRFAALPDLHDRAVREQVWTSRLADLGWGERPAWQSLLDDDAWTAHLIHARDLALPAEDGAAAAALMALWKQLHDALPTTGRRPAGRLRRALAVLRPADVTTMIDTEAGRVVCELLLGQRPKGDPLGDLLKVCRRLRGLLPNPHTARGQAERNAFLWWLSRHVDEIDAGLDEEPEPAPTTLPWPPFDALRDALSAKLVIDVSDLATLDHVLRRPDPVDGLPTGSAGSVGARQPPPRRFVLSAGLSGTGKTRVALRYAELVCERMALDPDRHVALVAVSPAWDDPSGLLGYANPLTTPPTFVHEAATRLLLDAAADPDRPYFLLLDEMNLARVERYLAPVLSAMETGAPLRLHGASGLDTPQTLPWPRNLRVIGTVNLDETTFPFSDKVLDRAVTIEAWDADLAAWAVRRGAPPAVRDALLALYAALRPCRRHFGYRTADEVLDLAPLGLDAAVLAKVLPRVRGQEADGLRDALDRVVKICDERGLTRSRDRAAAMREQLARSGLCSFWSTG